MPEEKEVATESNGQEKTDNNMVATDLATESNGQEKTDNTMVATDLEESIIRQVEFYFGDMNLVRDKFLREQMKLDDGWVPFDVLITFNRLAKLSKDAEVIANALSKSTSGLLELSEDNKKVRRNPEMPVPEMNEERRKELYSRTVYAKGFPKDAELDDLLKFFNEQGEVETLIMRRYLDKATKTKMYKGSVFTTFKNKEQAEKFLETKGIKYGETELIVMWQESYLQKKQDEYAEKKEKREKKSKDAAVKEEKEEFKLPTGTVLHFSEAPNTMKREQVKEALTQLGADVAYIDFNVGDTEGHARLSKENAAKELFPKIPDGKLKIGESEVVFKLLEGDEETAFLQKTVGEMVKRRKNQKNFGRQKNKSNYRHNNRQGGRKRKQDQNDDGPPSKVKADS